MAQKANNSSKPGIDELVGQEDLLKRYKVLRHFLQHNWGLIGFRLKHVKKPADVRNTLHLIHEVKWCIPFRDYSAKCLLGQEDSRKVSNETVDVTRKAYTLIDDALDYLWREYHNRQTKVSQLATAVTTADADLQPKLLEKLRINELKAAASDLHESITFVQEAKQELETRLASLEAGCAQNQIVEFVKNTRYAKDLENFAKVMAGLPEYTWLHSIRRLLNTPEQQLHDAAFNFQLFELLRSIVNVTKPLKVAKIETRMRDRLLGRDANPLLRGYASGYWFFMKEAFAACRGKGTKRSVLPFTIMGHFINRVDGPKTLIDLELAKLEEFTNEGTKPM